MSFLAWLGKAIVKTVIWVVRVVVAIAKWAALHSALAVGVGLAAYVAGGLIKEAGFAGAETLGRLVAGFGYAIFATGLGVTLARELPFLLPGMGDVAEAVLVATGSEKATAEEAKSVFGQVPVWAWFVPGVAPAYVAYYLLSGATD